MVPRDWAPKDRTLLALKKHAEWLLLSQPLPTLVLLPTKQGPADPPPPQPMRVHWNGMGDCAPGFCQSFHSMHPQVWSLSAPPQHLYSDWVGI